MNFDAGSRLFAVYVDDAQIDTAGSIDEAGVAFSPDFLSGGTTKAIDASSNPSDFADYGLWIGSSIVEAGSTILEANRRKFIDADGKPVDPSNWPANPVLKFVGNATEFATNQGSGPAFTVTGTLTNASTSPSD